MNVKKLQTDKDMADKINSFMDEALNLARLDHAYIIKYIDSFIFNAKFHIVMELCEVLFYIRNNLKWFK